MTLVHVKLWCTSTISHTGNAYIKYQDNIDNNIKLRLFNDRSRQILYISQNRCIFILYSVYNVYPGVMAASMLSIMYI